MENIELIFGDIYQFFINWGTYLSDLILDSDLIASNTWFFTNHILSGTLFDINLTWFQLIAYAIPSIIGFALIVLLLKLLFKLFFGRLK